MTIPKAIADEYGIAPGDEIDFAPGGDAIRVRRRASSPARIDIERRLDVFDRATERQQGRDVTVREPGTVVRGWRREDLYGRACAR